MTGDVLNLALWAAGIMVSTAIAVFFFFLGRKEPRPVYYVSGITVVRAQPEQKIEVRFRGTDVPVVTRTVIAFWNAGRQPIRRTDIVDRHPLTVVLPDGAEVLQAQIIAMTRPDIDFLVAWGEPIPMPDGTADIKTHLIFSFLNHCDGATVEILHTGDDPYDVTVEGAIVGANGPPRRIDHVWADPLKTTMLPAISVGAFSAFGLFFLQSNTPAAIACFACAVAATALAIRYRMNRIRVPGPLLDSVGYWDIG